jgi:hypothetical protein
MLFIHEPIVQLLGLYMAYIYGHLYCMHPNSFNLMLSYIFQCSSRQYLRFFKICIISEWELLVFTTSLSVSGLLLDHNLARYLWTGYMCGSNPAMEALESPNLDCVSISVQFVFSPSSKQLILLCYSPHRSWNNLSTCRLADYWLVCTESCFLAGT